MTSHKDVRVATPRTDVSTELEKAVLLLLKPPHLYYLKELHDVARTDPAYIFNNESTVCTNIQQILAKEGLQWKPDFLARHWQRLVGMAFHKLEER